MAFDITSVLKDVPDSGTGREQIEYLRLEQLESDINNFYQLSKLDELAANIQMCGLQQPIRVRKCPEKPDSYTIVSGHRRRAAIELLASEEPERWAEVPCIVEQDEVSPALQQLRLIYANANTRVLLPAEISEQAVQVEKLLYQLKEEGYEFPGRMRDHVAQAVGASKSKLSRLKVIREGLAPCWGKMFKKGHLHENPAYELARLPRDKQELIFNSRKTEDERRYIGASRIERYADRFKQIDALKCRKDKNKKCDNCERKYNEAVHVDQYGYFECHKCCASCSRLVSCRHSCPKLADEVKKRRAERKEQKQNEMAAKEEKEKPIIDFVRSVYARLGEARSIAGKSLDDVFKMQQKFPSVKAFEEFEALEKGQGKPSVNTDMPFGYCLSASSLMKICAVADGLDCSIDYLLGRAENLRPTGGWQNGTPWNLGEYAVVVRWANGCKKSVERMEWDGENWRQFGESIEIFPDTKIFGWIELPEEE